MKISVITVCFNAQRTIRDTLESVRAQDYSDIEHIVVDGGSTDGTQDIVREYGNHLAHFISEPDRGLYDAMNKGWKLATGEFVGYLHADDIFTDSSCVRRIAEAAKGTDADLILGDVNIVDPQDLSRSVRFYSAQKFDRRWIEQGDMPPYPGLYVRRSVFDRYGGYDLQFPLSADFDFVARLVYVNSLQYVSLPYTLITMRFGGLSSRFPSGPIRMLRDVYRACKKNGIRATPISFATKYLRKLRQFSFAGPFSDNPNRRIPA